MAYTTLIPAVLVNEVELTDLVTHLANVLNVKVQIEQCFIIKTDDLNLSDMMDHIAAQLNGGNGTKPIAETKKGKPKAASAGTIGKKSLLEEKTGMVISKQTLKKLLAEGTVANNTVYKDYKGGRFVVLDNKLIREPNERIR